MYPKTTTGMVINYTIFFLKYNAIDIINKQNPIEFNEGK